MRSFDLSPLFRSSVGFDQLDKMFDTAFREAARDTSYPPYNIAKLGAETYRITMAVAGFANGDLDITIHDNVLIVKGQISRPEKDVEYLHRGIAQRAFEHRFQLADHIKVSGADLTNGLLDIHLKREVPEQMKPRKVSIGGAAGPTLEQAPAAEKPRVAKSGAA
jgi:molecular chaperone IbpA